MYIIIKKILKEDMSNTPIEQGQVLICTDAKRVHLDYNDTTRRDITTSCVIFLQEQRLLEVTDAYVNRLYVALDTGKLWRNLGEGWEEVLKDSQILEIIRSIDEYVISLFVQDGQMLAPINTANNVLLEDGSKLSTMVNSSKILTMVRCDVKYVQATRNDQKIFNIPFPKDNYNFLNGDSMVVMKDNFQIPTTRYVVNNGLLILNNDAPTVNTEELIAFVFYYKMTYDLNNSIQIGTDNLADNSITSQKLAESFRLSADKVIETIDRYFMSADQKNKINTVEYQANYYIHPKSHPATMITEDDTHLFVTTADKTNWNHKADSTNVYTKTETQELFHDLIGAAPGVLDTLQELANALDNDPNFAASMTMQLALKADKTQLAALEDKVDTKVNKNDYIRNPMYVGTHSFTKRLDSTNLYSMSSNDATFKEYIDGMVLRLKVNNTNTGTVYFKIDKLDEVEVITQDLYQLIPGELSSGSIYEFIYNGSKKNFHLKGKGGVKIKDTAQIKYNIQEEHIERGDLVELIDNKVYLSRPRVKIYDQKNTDSLVKFYSDSYTKVLPLSDTSFMAFWKLGNSLRCQIIHTKVGYSGEYIDINSETKTYTEIANNVEEFDVCRISDTRYGICYGDTEFKTKTMLIEAENKLAINLLGYYEKQEQDHITHIAAIRINYGRDKFIVAYESGEFSRTMYFSTTSEQVTLISTRLNTSYPMDKVCKVSDTQIVFGKASTNIVQSWVMIVSDNDFFNGSLNTVYTDQDSGVIYNGLNISKLEDNTARYIWYNNSLNKMYNCIFTVDNNGGLTMGEFTMTEISGSSLILPEQILYNDEYSLSVSNYDGNRPFVATQDNCIKVMLTKDADPTKIIDIVSDIPVTSSNISFCMMNDEKFIAMCNIRSGQNMNLYFILGKIRKLPHGVALQSGSTGGSITVDKW